MTFSGRPSMPPSSTALSDLYEVSSASKERSSQNTMNRCLFAARSKSISSGKLSMSSRWISTSLRAFPPEAALTEACTALTRDDLPMPRAPQSSALLAGSPRANRSVFSTSVSRMRSIPLSRDISTRLTSATGVSRRPCGCQANASAAAKSGGVGAPGASRSSAAAMRPKVSPSLDEASCDLFGDFDLDLAIAPLRSLSGAVASPQASVRGPHRGGRRCNWGHDRYSPRRFRAQSSRYEWAFDADFACLCPGRRRRYRHADGTAAVRAHFRHHVFPHPATTTKASEAASGNGEKCAPRRYCSDLRRAGRQGHQGAGRGPTRDRD